MSMSIDEMTEEQILKEIFNTIPAWIDYAKQNGSFDQRACVERVLENLCNLFNTSRHIGYYDRILTKDLQDRESLIAHYTPLVTEHVEQIAIDFSKEQMAAEINKAKAHAIINAAFAAAGLKTRVRFFESAAQVSVRLPGKKWAQLYIPYHDIKGEGCLDDLISAIMDLKNVVARIGRSLTVGKYK